MKRALVWMLTLAIVFAVIATIVAPSALGWYFTPPEGGVVMMKGDDAVRWGIRRLIQAQLIGLALGAVVGLFIGIKFRRKAPAAAATGTLSASSGAPALPQTAAQRPVATK